MYESGIQILAPIPNIWQKGLVVVSIGHYCAFYVVFVPQEYFPTVPPHSIYVIVSCFILLQKVRFSKKWFLNFVPKRWSKVLFPEKKHNYPELHHLQGGVILWGEWVIKFATQISPLLNFMIIIFGTWCCLFCFCFCSKI